MIKTCAKRSHITNRCYSDFPCLYEHSEHIKIFHFSKSVNSALSLFGTSNKLWFIIHDHDDETMEEKDELFSLFNKMKMNENEKKIE